MPRRRRALPVTAAVLTALTAAALVVDLARPGLVEPLRGSVARVAAPVQSVLAGWDDARLTELTRERNALAAFGRSNRPTRGRILCYHSVGTPVYRVNDVSPKHFRRHLELMLARGQVEAARSWLKMLEDVDRDHPVVEHFRRLLAAASRGRW